MFITTALCKKIALAFLILAIGLTAFPYSRVSAASLEGRTPSTSILPINSRLERVWAREQSLYRREGALLTKAGDFVAKVQALIDKADQKGWDASAVQAALNAFSAVIPTAQAAHDKGSAIVTSHAGFDANGKVTDRTTAMATVKALAQVLKDTHTAMDGTGRALRQAVRALRQANRNAVPPTP